MPADALPVPHGAQSLSAPMTLLPGGGSGFTLTFGSYADPTFAGMQGILSLPVARVHIASGAVLQQSWTVTIGSDGTGSIANLPFTDDAAFTAAGQSFSLQWQALSYKPTPGNKTFTVPTTAGATVDYDLIVSAATVTAAAPVGLDALVASLLADRTSATYARAVALPNYPNGA